VPSSSDIDCTAIQELQVVIGNKSQHARRKFGGSGASSCSHASDRYRIGTLNADVLIELRLRIWILPDNPAVAHRG
jgi:hypothetical protein